MRQAWLPSFSFLFLASQLLLWPLLSSLISVSISWAFFHRRRGAGVGEEMTSYRHRFYASSSSHYANRHWDGHWSSTTSSWADTYRGKCLEQSDATSAFQPQCLSLACGRSTYRKPFWTPCLQLWRRRGFWSLYCAWLCPLRLPGLKCSNRVECRSIFWVPCQETFRCYARAYSPLWVLFAMRWAWCSYREDCLESSCYRLQSCLSTCSNLQPPLQCW